MHHTTTQRGAARANTLDIAAAFIGDNGTPQAASRKPQAASRKPQAASRKPQAASRKPQAASRNRPERSVASSLEPRPWRGLSRFSLLTILALLAGMLSLFTPAPADAQTTVWSATLRVKQIQATDEYKGCKPNPTQHHLG